MVNSKVQTSWSLLRYIYHKHEREVEKLGLLTFLQVLDFLK